MSQNSIEGLPRCTGHDVLVLDTYADFYRPAAVAAGVKFGSKREPSQDVAILKEQFDIEPNFEIITSTFGTIPRFIEGTQRISTVYRHIAEKWFEYLPIKLAALPFDMREMEWGIQWHKYRDRDPEVQWLRTTIISIAREQF